MLRISEPTFLGRELEYVQKVIASRALSMGWFVSEFESLVAQSMDAEHCVATSSGTTALHTALLALGLKPGQRVIVPACSYIATANAVRYCGGEPIFVDVNPFSWTLDPKVALDAIRRFDAVGMISVDLYGVDCPVPEVSGERGFWILQDACEAHGTMLRGDAAVFSFYGNKIVTCGEGGAIVTNSSQLEADCRRLIGQGTFGLRRYVHEILGYNYRLTDLQAAVGCAQMEKLDEHLARRSQLAKAYATHLNGEVGRQFRPAGSSDWVMPIVCRDRHNRDRLAQELLEKGIETRPVFPALGNQPQYADRDWNTPVADYLGKKGLLLPLHLQMTEEDVKRVCGEFKEWLCRVAS